MVFGDEGAEILSQFLQKNSNTESLELRGNQLTSDGFAKIVEALMGNSTLKSLAAEWNNIGSGVRGIEALCEFVGLVQNVNENILLCAIVKRSKFVKCSVKCDKCVKCPR